MERITYLAIISLTLFLLFSNQIINAQPTNKLDTKISVPGNPDSYSGGELKIIVSGEEIKLSDNAKISKVINDGEHVVYSTRPGAGGFENEGESIRIYDVKTKHTRKILSEYFMIDGISEHKLSNGRTALLVKMSDGGLGAEYVAVVDPMRAEVFFKANSRIAKVSGDKMTLNVYDSGDDMVFEEENKGENIDFQPKPPKKKTFDLKELLNIEEVIFNENTLTRYLDNDQSQKRVKVYYWRVNDVLAGHNFLLAPVYRHVNPKAPLKPTLEALFGKIKKDEEDYGFGNPTHGMNFEGVVLKDGIATVKVSQVPNYTNYGTLAPYIFLKAIEKTALQFPTVKSVRVCKTGETNIDSQTDNLIMRCS